MKKILFISLLCISAFIADAQLVIKINEYLRDSISGGVNRLWLDTSANPLKQGHWKDISSGSGGGSGGSGTVSSGAQYRLAYYATAGTTVSNANAITGGRALISDANGVPTHSAVTDLQLSYVGNVTSDIQAQINLKAPIASPTFTGTVVIPNGSNLGTPTTLVGTNITGTASGLTAGNVTTNANLTGDITSVGNATAIASGVIVNADVNASAAIDATKLIDGSITNTELGYINTLSSNAQTQIDTKQATLVSGTNIKTINGSSVLGSGDLVAGTTINNNADNRLITGSGTANTLEGEDKLTFNAGSRSSLTVGNGTNGADVLLSGSSGSSSGFSSKIDGTASMAMGFGSGGEYGGSIGVDGRNFYVYDYVVPAYRMGMGPSGDLYIGPSPSSYSARFGPSGNVLANLFIPEQATPSTPGTAYAKIYPKADGLWYGLDDAGVETKLSNDAGVITKNAAFGMSAPTSSEDAMVFFTPIAITITNVQEALVGSSPSVTYTINYGSARNSATGTIVASHAATSTTGTAATLNVTSIPANSYIWITTSATSGTVNDWNVSISYK